MIDVEGPEQSLVITKGIWKDANKWWKQKPFLWMPPPLKLKVTFKIYDCKHQPDFYLKI